MMLPAVIRNGREEVRYLCMAAELVRLDGVLRELCGAMQIMHERLSALEAFACREPELPGEQPLRVRH